MRWCKPHGIGALWQRMLRARPFIPLTLVVASALLVGASVNVLTLVGQWPPQLPQLMRSRSNVVITGPNADTSASDTIQAYVLGAVRSPGVYTLPQDARVHDLLTTAGGSLDGADLTRVAMAAPLSDGETVYVPLVGETVPLELGGKIDLNTASAEDLRHALGLSLTIARRIITYRTAHGDFTSVSQLLLVPLSRTTYDRIKDLVTV